MSLRRPFALVAVTVASLLAACGSGSPDPSAAAGSSLAECRAAGGRKLTTVMTRNLYLGADLMPAIAATSQTEFLAATTGIWQMVLRNDFDLRVQGIADEIAAAHPALVGLQEASTWTYATAPGAEETVVYDYVRSITDALAARGLDYRPVAAVELTDLQAPILVSVAPVALAYVRWIDHGVILAREGVKVRNAQGHVFASLLPIQILGQPSQVKRGWVSVQAKHHGEWLTFASTHLEAFHWYYRLLQAQELAATLAAIPGRMVLVGDLNSDPLDTATVDGTPAANALAYQTLVGSGLQDTWLALHPGEPGFTSPYHEDLTIEPIVLDERIDHVLFRGLVEPRAEAVVGTQPSDRVCGLTRLGIEECLWPSDHAGLQATFRLEEERFDHQE